MRQWILDHSKSAARYPLNDQTQILEQGFLTSLDVVELVLFLEELRGAEIEADDIDPEVFACVDSLWNAFFARARAR
jgi:acyl carrier protein